MSATIGENGFQVAELVSAVIGSATHSPGIDPFCITQAFYGIGQLDFVAGAAQPFAAGTAPSVLPAQDSLPVDAALEGRLSGIDEGAVALLLIGPTGRLQNVTGEMGADGVFSLPPRRLRVPQAADLGADAPFLLLALRSAMPLDTVSLIPENAVLPADQVGEFWRFLGQDIARQGEESEGSEVRATLSAVRLGR